MPIKYLGFLPLIIFYALSAYIVFRKGYDSSWYAEAATFFVIATITITIAGIVWATT